MTESQRIDYGEASPGAACAVLALEQHVRSCGLEGSLIELVKIRASQLNGCGYCLDMHTKDARAAGESEQRIYCLSAWREAPFYSARERAALVWTELLTSPGPHGIAVSDDALAAVRREFADQELVDLTAAVAVINTWNRFAIAFRTEVGSYQPG